MVYLSALIRYSYRQIKSRIDLLRIADMIVPTSDDFMAAYTEYSVLEV